MSKQAKTPQGCQAEQSHAKAQGVKGLQSIPVYIASVILAFFFYHIDKHEGFGKAREATTEQVGALCATASQRWNETQSYVAGLKELEPIMPYMFMIQGTVLIALVLVGLYYFQVYRLRRQQETQRRQREAEEQAHAELELLAEEPPCPCCGKETRHQCEQIGVEEFERQARAATKKEVSKLVASQAYQKHAAARGKEAANWNWQLYDKSQGIYPDDPANEGASEGLNE